MVSSAPAAVTAEPLFVAAGCNRIVNNVSWGPSALVSFGAQNAVAIFSPESARICATLPGHRATVNCTEWIPSLKDAPRVRSECQLLVSGGADGVIILWELNVKDRKWRQVSQLPESHKKGVTCITGYTVSKDIAIFVSTSSDCSVLIWNLNLPSTPGGDCRLTLMESLCVGSRPMVTLSLTELPGNTDHMVLAMGGLDHKVHLYSGETTGKFVKVCELKGHTDWVRSLDFSLPVFSGADKKSIFLVSSSQDRSIRIWKLASHSSADLKEVHQKKEIDLASYIEGPLFLAGSSSYQVSLESLLIGHEDWVYSVEWHPPLLTSTDENEFYQPLNILSASMDKTMMIWRPEKTTGIWVNMVTVGELSHCALGFYGGHWSPDGKSILAHGYGGSFHLWRNIGADYENWVPQKVPSGHFSDVSDLAWAKSGEYVLSVSHDQTARIFTPWNEVCIGDKAVWHEIARPQVHGHDINCVAVILGKGNHRFVCGADEKVARVFEAPLSFLKTLSFANSSSFEDLQEEVQVLGANMSALGLSQKPIYVYASTTSPSTPGPDIPDSLQTFPDSVPRVLSEPPVEDQLGWHTLWPETHKLYGHGNELFALCCSHKGNLVASACKAQSAAVAEIWLWEVGSWKAVGRLQSHNLTVTQMEFSSDDSFLLAVSRDRHFSVFSVHISSEGEIRHQLVAKHDAHKRIIWSCSWNPFGHEFATGSRDKTVKIWGVDGRSTKNLLTLPLFSSSVTALSWLGCERESNSGLLAVGMESGFIELWSLSSATDSDGGSPKYNAVPALRFDPFVCHVSVVHRLAWKNRRAGESKAMELASCGADHCLRVFEVKVLNW